MGISDEVYLFDLSQIVKTNNDRVYEAVLMPLKLMKFEYLIRLQVKMKVRFGNSQRSLRYSTGVWLNILEIQLRNQ